MKKSKIFDAMIHNEVYLDPFMDDLVTSVSLISDFGRSVELLNGHWNFTIDPYDTCLRGN